MIELRTLGGLELRDERGGDICPKLQPKRQALLIYLAHAPRRFHRRDSLMALFWPELDPSGARNSLRQALYELRRTLGKGVLEGRGYEEVSVVERFLWSDAVEFDAALKANDPEGALELYRGDLLEGFHVQNVAPEFERWLHAERTELRSKAVRVGLMLADREEARGDIAAAVRWAQMAARLDPDNEGVLRRLIELLDRAGDRAGAIRTFDTFARRAREELDIEPTEETQALILLVRARAESEGPPSAFEPWIHEPLTTFIGRERELAALDTLLVSSDTRLLTMIGPGGCGKTRLALQLARRMEARFKGGVAFVGLNDARSVDEALACIALAVGLRQDGRQGPRTALRRYLADRELLLVLDGFDRVPTAGFEVARLLQAASRLKVLVTSRAPLKVSGEREFPVLPLSLPVRLSASVEFPLNSEAVALFVERAGRVRPDFRLTARNVDSVAEICRRLDGLPLAIELAAARVKSLTPSAIAERLEARFALLRGGATDLPLRHQSLETAIGWSCELLDDGERALFRRLGIFAGGFGLEVAEPMFQSDGTSPLDLIDGLATLVDYSLVSQLEIDGKPRFEMLDTVHAYAQKLLAESGEEKKWRRLHARQVLAWAEDGERHYCTPEQNRWFQVLERDNENIQAALEWAFDRDEASIAVRLAAALWPFWLGAGGLVRGREWLERILEMKGRAPRTGRAKALLGASWAASAAGRHEVALEHAKRGVALYRATGDRSGQIRALEALGFVALEAGKIDRARSAFDQCLARNRALGDARRQAIALDALGKVALAEGNDLVAEDHFREGVSIARRIGHTTAVAEGLVCLGDVALRSGAHERALGFHEEALALYREAGQKLQIGWTLCCLGSALVGTGRLVAARESYAEALPIFHELGYVRGMAFALHGFAAIAVARGDAEGAARLLGGSEILLERADDRFSPSDEAALAALRSSMENRLPRRSAPQWSEGRQLDADRLVALALAGEPTAVRRALA